jgi:hypothetical protein
VLFAESMDRPEYDGYKVIMRDCDVTCLITGCENSPHHLFGDILTDFAGEGRPPHEFQEQ